MSELKPYCLHCGDPMRSYPHQGYWWFQCKCGARSPTVWHGTEADAIAAWNRRAQPDNEPLTLEELRGMDREPIWVEFDGDEMSPPQSHWCFVQRCGGIADIYPCDVQEVTDWSYPDRIFTPGGSARAYRRKPEPEGGEG